ncbi:hypothetical protein [Desulfosarcina sp.]|uniref:hypothetical protein n=1 Tax=Desulfosarcina sp. TaxID=2027861 RepID=UPI0029BD2C9C|nr:hypothetical protein [Desulfosarcina sp.]MDX2454458.1 hypothetical protein [Desulfosarcina sp.]MDX2492105.1 hypothetical protein [Desulfosarcina sp.]
MNRAGSVVVALYLLCLVITVGVAAAQAKALDIPASLEPWRAWVLHDKAEQQCPAHFDNGTIRRCWWSSRLVVDVGDLGGLFEQQVTVYAPSWVTLPGDEAHWPESVSLGSKALPVVGRNGRPSIWLEPENYTIRGAFVWNTLPEVLQVPVSTGLLSLTVDGREIVEPDLDQNGHLRLHGKGGTARLEDTMTATLFRLIEDDIPMRLITRVLLEVSGRPREIRLASLLPDGAAAMKIDSPLPARLTHAGDLLVQARPGRWDVRVTVRLDGPVKTLSTGKGLYGDEIWSFKAFNGLRMVKVLGAPTLEPSRTRMPDEWKGFPAYQLKPGAVLSFEVLRRGDPDPAPDQLDLVRTWWLDFDGSGFTINDRIGGTLSRTWHLAMEAPMELGRVAVDGQDQLITLQGERPSPGVQLRRGQLSLEADSRLARTSSIVPAIGWDHDFKSVRGLLHLPPGWTLFSAAGVDVPPGAWLQRWTLLDFFLVLIIAISAYQIRNRTTGLLALVTLVLTFHEPGAPRQVWLHLLAVAALLKYLPNGWFKTVVKLWGASAVVALIAITMPFMVQQVRTAIYPQLAQGGDGILYRPAAIGTGRVLESRMADAPETASVGKRLLKAAEEIQLSRPQPTPRKTRFVTDPDALVQTGPGLPVWQWRSVQLLWNGPVDRTQQIRLWLVSPSMNLALGLIRVALLFLLVVAFLDLRNWRRHLPEPGTAIGSALILMLIFLAPVQLLRAEPAGQAFPPQPLLDELQQRMLEPAPCLPHCADVSRLELAATPDQLRLIMQMHAQIDTAIPLPATLETWRPNRIILDNQPVKSLSRDDRGTLWMVLPRGVHQVKMIGPPGNADEIRITFPIVPHVGTYAGVGWQARGFGPDGSMDATIALSRTQSDSGSPTDVSRTDIPAFFLVAHTLHLGIQWDVTTRIQRLTEPGVPAVLSVPLMENASVTTPGIHVEDRVAQVSLGPDDMETQFSTTIPIAPAILLTAPRDMPWTESWTLDAAAMWRCSVSGLTVVHHQDEGRNWQPQWRPWPGEQVRIDVARPKAVAGRTITVDRSVLALTPGQRFSRAMLTLGIRSSKGGHHQIELPTQANLQTVTIDGKTLPIRQDGRLVTVPLEPGSQTVRLAWNQLNDSMTRVQGPQVNVGDAAVNAAVTFHMPDHRWILLAGGPRLGPAVLFWSYLIVVVVVAVGLGKTVVTPLRTHHWLLLGLGLTQVPAVVALLVVGWLLAMGTRCRKAPENALAFNGIQLLLVILTVAAMVGLYTAIERGLLGIPDMQIAGNQSTRFQLNWTQDRIGGNMPTPWVVSLPQWIYHLLMLVWSLWLAFSLVSWLRWAWGCFSKTHLWKPVKWRRKTKPAKEGNVRREKDPPDTTPMPHASGD